MLACGRMGLEINYLYSLTSRQFSNMQTGWNANLEMQTKTSWEQTRKLFDAIIRPHLKDKNTSGLDLMPFPWDKKEEVLKEDVQELSSAELAERWERIDKMKKESMGKL